MLKGKTHFYLKSEAPDSNGEITLYAQVTFGGGKIRKNLFKIKKREWNPKRQEVRPPIDPLDKKLHNIVVGKNRKICDFRDKVESYFEDILLRGITPTFDQVKDFVLNDRIIENTNISFKAAWEKYIDSKVKITSKREARSVLNFLIEFETETGTSLTFENQSMVFYDQLQNFAYVTRETVVSTNYFAKIIKVLKAFLNWCIDRNYYSGNAQRRYKKIEKSKSIITLSLEDQEKLFNYQFDNENYARIRDVFCFSCYTGLRISDIQTLEHTHIRNNIIYKNLVKTAVDVRIPLTDKAIEIVERYKGKPIYVLPRFTDQYLNRELKNICEKVGIKEPTRIEQFIAGQRKELVMPKHKLITFHTARKTFVTNCVRNKTPLYLIMQMTGHTTDKELKKYYEIEEFLLVDEMNKWNT